MCHRYFQAHQAAKVADRYGVRGPVNGGVAQVDPQGGPSFEVIGEADEIPAEVFPTHQSVVVLSDKGERILTSMHWGFIPGWIKDEDMAGYDKPNNSRAETVMRNLMDGRGMYFQAMRSGRCILSASSWCEWTGEKGNKTAHRLSVRGSEFVSFAGLYTYRKGFPGFSCTMITTAAEGAVAQFHHRVPVVLLSREDEDRWLDPASDPRELVGLFQSIPDEMLVTEVLDEPPPMRRRKSGQDDLFSFE